MYHKDLVKDLQKIFGIKKIVFSSVEYGAEQDVIYCDVISEKNRPSNGHYYFVVRGTIGFNAQHGNTKKGGFIISGWQVHTNIKPVCSWETMKSM